MKKVLFFLLVVLAVVIVLGSNVYATSNILSDISFA